MRYTFSFLLILCFFKAEAQFTFQKTYGGAGDEKSYCIKSTSDGGYILAGYTESFGNGGKDAYVIKLDVCGNIQWSKTFGDTGDEIFHWIEQTSDGGYIAAGAATGHSSGIAVVTLTKLDSFGNLEWSKYFDNQDSYLFGGVVHQSFDHGYILMARNSPNNNFYLVKCDSIGNLQWSKTFFSGLSSKIGGGIMQTSDSGFICTGFTSTPNYGLCAIKMDKSGIVQWSKIYENNGGVNESSYYVEVTNDGGFLYIGESQQIGAGLDNVYLIRTDTVGNFLWAKTYGIAGLNIRSFSGMQTADHGFIIDAYSYSNSNIDACLIKTDSVGNIIWAKSYGGSGDDPSYFVNQSADNGFVVAGWTNSFGSGQHDIYLIKTDEFGNCACNQGTPTFSTTPCFPNVTSISPVESIAINNSILNLNTTNPNTTVSFVCLNQNPQSICSGTVYTINGHTYSTAGTYYDTLISNSGCDSLVITQLTLTNSSSSSLSVIACDNYNWFGNIFSVSGIYQDTITNAAGCDSILTLNLSINPTDSSSSNVKACNNYFWNGNNYMNSGTYKDTISTSTGCDSIIILHLIINRNSYFNKFISICQGDVYSFNGHNYSEAGLYYDTLNSITGCDSIVTSEISLRKSPSIDAGEDIILTEMAAVQLSVTGANQYVWSTGDTSSTISVFPSGTTLYFVTGIDSNSCSNTDSIWVFINSEFSFFVPNTFTPDDDGLNDNFTGNGKCIDKVEMNIYDRWGEKIYHSDDLKKSWDGTLKKGDEKAQSGIYVYKINIIDCYGNDHSFIGHVTILY